MIKSGVQSRRIYLAVVSDRDIHLQCRETERERKPATRYTFRIMMRTMILLRSGLLLMHRRLSSNAMHPRLDRKTDVDTRNRDIRLTIVHYYHYFLLFPSRVRGNPSDRTQKDIISQKKKEKKKIAFSNYQFNILSLSPISKDTSSILRWAIGMRIIDRAVALYFRSWWCSGWFLHLIHRISQIILSAYLLEMQTLWRCWKKNMTRNTFFFLRYIFQYGISR